MIAITTSSSTSVKPALDRDGRREEDINEHSQKNTADKSVEDHDHNGQPLAGADVVFKLKDGSRSSFGRTDDKGHYELTTRSSNDGAAEGDYVVSITKTEAPAQDASKLPLQEDKNYNPYVGKGASAA